MNWKKQQNLSKAMGVLFNWVIDIVKQKQFGLFWKPGVIKFGDYFTKHHLPAHHKEIIPVYLHCPNIVQASARVC